MSKQMVLNNVSIESRQFSAALTVSLLVHVVMFWLVHYLSASNIKKNVLPVNNTLEIALISGIPQPSEKGRGEQVGTQHESAVMPIRAVAKIASDMHEQVSSLPNATAADGETGTEGIADAGASVMQGHSSIDADARERYLATVLQIIEAHKFYPAAARRRGLQGQVEVRFTLDARGVIFDLQTSGSSSLFEEAARAAVQNAVPLPAAPASEGFPLPVRYQMIFQLQ